MLYTYGWEKLHMGVFILVGGGNQADRLVDAIQSSLINIKAKDHLPEEMQRKFIEFMVKMASATDVANEGKIRATVNGMSEKDIDKACEKIVDFYDQVCREFYR